MDVPTSRRLHRLVRRGDRQGLRRGRADGARARIASITREPVGVVGAVVPWNFPLLMAAWKLGPALATGNSVVAQARRAVAADGAAHRGARRRGRAPGRRLNVVPGFGETAGEAIGAAHGRRLRRVHRLDARSASCFLRYSRRVEHEARRRSSAAASRRTSCSPTSRDLDRAADGRRVRRSSATRARTARAGSRLHRPRVGARTSCSRRSSRSADAWPAGDPLDPETRMGAIVDAAAARTRARLHRGGRERGRGVHLGGKRVREETRRLLRRADDLRRRRNDMTIAREEIFGPVLSAIAFDDRGRGDRDRERHDLRPRGRGLDRRRRTSRTASRARSAGRRRLGERYAAGDITSPFGGFKQSGFGAATSRSTRSTSTPS